MLWRNRFARNLPADWAALKPSLKPFGYSGQNPRFSYDACRIPLYLGWSLTDPRPYIEPMVDFWASGARPSAVYDFQTGQTGEAANAGIHGIYQFSRWMMTGQTPRFKSIRNEPFKYYSGSLLLLAQAAYDIRLAQAPFSRPPLTG